MCQTNQKPRLMWAVMLFVMFMSTLTVFGDQMKIGDLISEPEAWDGKTITVEGEVIGDVMVRGDHAWINISDGSGVIGIWVTQEDGRKIKLTGDYKHIGDSVTVDGVFHQTFTAQNGDMAIESKLLEIKEEGIKVVRPISNSKVFWAVGLTLLVVILNWGRIMIWIKQKLKWPKYQ